MNMSDTGAPDPANAPAEGASEPAKSEFAPITSQEEFEARLSKRLDRERAKFSDYDDLKTRAAKLDEIEQANKSELEREREQREALARENETLRLGKLRSDIAAEKGVPASLLSGSTKEEIEAAAEALIEFRNEATKPRSPKPDPSQGRGDNNTPSGDWLRDSLAR